MLHNGKTFIRAMSDNPGTAFIKSAPETAGTAAPVLGFIFSAIVPPVEIIQTRGRFFAAGIFEQNKVINRNNRR